MKSIVSFLIILFSGLPLIDSLPAASEKLQSCFDICQHRFDLCIQNAVSEEDRDRCRQEGFSCMVDCEFDHGSME